MFEMLKIGKLIAELREKASLSQEDMAGKLEVSQATVASWEQGLTMPDISYLPLLADLFGITIDELLGRQQGSHIISQVAAGHVAELVQEQPISVAEFRHVEPLLKPKQLEELSDALAGGDHLSDLLDSVTSLSRKAAERVVRHAISRDIPIAEYLPELLCNINRDLADEVLLGAMERGEDFDIEECIPFVSRATADKLVRLLIEQDRGEEMVDLLPFISREAAGELLARFFDSGHTELLPEVLPFVSREAADELVRQSFGKIDGDNLSEILPFISRACADELIQSIDLKEIDTIAEIIPFISRDAVGELLLKALEAGEELALEAVLPFAGKGIADQLIANALEKNIPFKIKDVLPFISEDLLDKILSSR
ncbi:MAG: helix-turn-helix domain-containing protein [Symbiobacteriaceae bacterium]|nr:helix-turn-helix domain-containing protein [Symbiobacteriaceae bacterium]